MGGLYLGVAPGDSVATPNLSGPALAWSLLKLASRGSELVFETGIGRIESHLDIWNRCWDRLRRQAGIVGQVAGRQAEIGAARSTTFIRVLVDRSCFSSLRAFRRSSGIKGIQITLDSYTHLWPAEDDY
jgi:hypothetical protein